MSTAQNRILCLVLRARHDVAATVEHLRAAGDADVLVVAVAVRRAEVEIDLHPLEVFVEQDVDDAGNGVRPVRGRRTARDHFQSVDQHARNGVELHAVAVVGRHVPLRIDERQRPGAEERVQAAQIRECGADEECAATGILRLKVRDVGRDLRHQVGDVDDAQALHVLIVDDGRRSRGVVVIAPDARSRDGDFLETGRRCRRWLLRR